MLLQLDNHWNGFSEKKQERFLTLVKKKIEFKPNTAHTNLLVKAGKLSAERSIRENKALGLPITYLEDGQIIREFADGRKEIIGTIDHA